MICFIWIDEAGHIMACQKNPGMSAVPLVHPFTLHDRDGKPFKDAVGRHLSHQGHRMKLPIEVSEEEFGQVHGAMQSCDPQRKQLAMWDEKTRAANIVRKEFQ